MKNFTFKQNTKFIPLVLCLLIYQITKAQDQEFVRQQYTPAEPACVYYADNYRGAHSTFRSQAVANNMSRGSACSSFIVTYNGFTPEAEAAFQFAVDIWANSIESSQPIRINANFAPLNAGVLGQAGPTNFFTSNAPGALPDVFYPIALWEKLEDRDSEDPPPFGNSDSVDISCTFSSTFNFYFGTDANPPNGQFDFVSIVLHELGHGLGFVGLASSDGSEGTIRVGNPPRPSVYSNFIENGSNTSILGFDDPSMALQNQLTGNNLFCNGPQAVAENGGDEPKIFAPNPYNGGSSYSHWDESTFLAGDINSLMTPQIGPGEANHNPGPITLGFFEDMGWSLCASLSTEEFEVADLNINPNPFSDRVFITINNGNSGVYNLDLFDIKGRLIKSSGATTTDGRLMMSNLQDLERALYFIKVTEMDTGLSITKKIVKN